MNVYEAAMRRIEYAFDNFEYVYVSFSGGKDSGVLLNMAAAAANGRRFGVFHMDYECQYSATTDYVAETLDSYRDVADIYHVCVPFKVTTCTSMYQSFWRPWDPSQRELWVRKLPDGAITALPILKNDMWDYDFQKDFSHWVKAERSATSVCCLVGIRTQESLNRWRTIYSDKNINKHDGKNWLMSEGDGIYHAYPIFDFSTQDIWVANAKFGWRYNKIYDLFFMAGVPIEQMRVASPFISEGMDALKLYRTIEPNMWGKMVSRVNGVNFAGIYGGTTAMGWKSITLPAGHTWESYMYFLLSTLPENTRLKYLSKLETSMEFWRQKGGCLSEDTIEKLRQAGVKIEVGEGSNYHTDKKPVRMDYIDDIDISEFKEIPTFKRMCVCIMKNDVFCKYMGFSLTKKELTNRKRIMDKYKDL